MDGLGLRVRAMAIAAPAAAMLILGAWLRPDPSGMGTHEQLGLAPCAFLQTHGYVCPTCGMTTAVSQASHGHLLASVATQPAAALLAMLAAMAVWIGGYVAVTGSPVMRYARPLWQPGWILLAATLIVMVSWLYKLWMTGTL